MAFEKKIIDAYIPLQYSRRIYTVDSKTLQNLGGRVKKRII